MDKLFVPNYIDLDYKFAVFKDNGNIELYQRENYTEPGLYRYWVLYANSQNKIITDSYGFYVNEGENKPIHYAHDIEVSHKWYDRPDSINILTFTLVISVVTIWIVNLFTSVFKKGGLLSGLF